MFGDAKSWQKNVYKYLDIYSSQRFQFLLAFQKLSNHNMLKMLTSRQSSVIEVIEYVADLDNFSVNSILGDFELIFHYCDIVTML